MRSEIRTPTVPLSAFVENLWAFSDTPLHPMERIVPSGTVELVFNLHENEFRIYHTTDTKAVERFSGAMVSGAYRRCFMIDTREHASVVGVHFRPGGVLPVLGVPPGAFRDCHVDLADLWGRAVVEELRERLCTAPEPKRLRILEHALLDRIRRPVRRHDAVPVALDLIGRGYGSGEIARRVDLSHRRLIQVFTAEVGLTPKRFARIQRFQQALTKSLRPFSEWSMLALECGYADQSHMIREFVEFSGLPPVKLAARRGDNLRANHLALA